MKKSLLLLFSVILIVGLGSCGVRKYNERYERLYRGFNKIEIKTLVEDSLLNVRAIEVVDSVGLIYLTSKGDLGVVYNEKFRFNSQAKLPKFVEVSLKKDSILPNFRSLAIASNKGYGLSVGSPALLYSLDIDLEKNKIVYKETHPKAFYDSMEFWNDQEGIAIGDPTEDCMSIIITRDGGETWTKLSCEDLPKVKDGEAAFAASDTNIAIIGDMTWVATGGKASRILYSPDKGKSWKVFDTPIIQGKPTTGMYSVDFYDETNGFAIGGDYTKPNDTLNNKIRTIDGGKTWHVVANGKGPGYRSCVQYVPNSNARGLVTVGFKGVDYSNDAGNTWRHLSDEGFYTIRFLNDSVAYAAGKGRISMLVFRD